jgi:5-methylcytosine-specific restriction enzyme subunit McrC
MSRQRVQIAEWESQIQNITLTDADRRCISPLSTFIAVDELRNSVRFTANSHVGVIQFDQFDLEIVPKLANGSFGLVDMVMFTHGIDTLRRVSAVRELQTDTSTSLFDLIALLFCEQCERILQLGLRHDYVECEEDLPVLRGRLLVSEQVRRHYGQIDRLTCRFDDYIENILDNQILRSALDTCRGAVSHPRVRFRVNRMHNLFTSACSSLQVGWREAREQTVYHRMNEHYREAHSLAWLLMESVGIGDLLMQGALHSFAFFINMNKLFESFVERLMRHVLRDTHLSVNTQLKSRTAIWNATSGKPYTEIVPDLIVSNPNGARITIDSKYKLYDEYAVRTGDIYQSFLYTLVHAEASAKQRTGIIVHPASHSMKITELHVRNRHNDVQARLLVIGFSIVEAINEIKNKRDGEIITSVRRQIFEALNAY